MVTIDGKKYLEITDVAPLLELSPQRVRQLCDDGRLPGAVQLSHCSAWLIPEAEAKKAAKIPRIPGRPRLNAS